MAQDVCICFDVEGTEKGVEESLKGAAAALAADPHLSLVLTGYEAALTAFAASNEGRVSIVPTTEIITMDEHPASAVRSKRDSSIVVGCRLVKEGRAQGFFSCGSTGACVAAATLHIGRAQGVARPMLVTVIPTPERPVVFGDIGGTADAKPEYLVQFALMASAYARDVLGFEDSRVGLLNIGEEETKGSQLARDAHALLRAQIPGFYGNVEGGDVIKGTCPVVVTDAFTGNVALKAMEATTKTLFKEIKKVLYTSTKTKLGAALIKNELYALKGTFNADSYGGAPVLGLKGACAIGHGSSNAEAIKNGILATAQTVRSGVCETVAMAIAALEEAAASAE